MPTMNRTPGRTRIQELWTKRVKNPDGSFTRIPAKRDGRGKRWKAEIVNDDGRPVSKAFGRKEDPRPWLEKQTAAMATGSYVDPKTGKVTLNNFYTDWSPDQVWVKGTRRAMDLGVNSATFGDVPFSSLRPSHVQARVKAMQDKPLQASTIHTRFVNVRGVVRAAVRDRLLANDVTANTRLPRQRKAAAGMAIPSPAELGDLLRNADAPFRRIHRLVRVRWPPPG
jgi:hypothetical protein